MAGSERVAVHFPLAAISLPGALDGPVGRHFEALRAVWEGFPPYEGDLADIDHLAPMDYLPDTAPAKEYQRLISERWSEFRLVPKRLARPLALMDFHVFTLLREIDEAVRLAARPEVSQ
jgi:hypothetical protein